jgi:hypothetical protein
MKYWKVEFEDEQGWQDYDWYASKAEGQRVVNWLNQGNHARLAGPYTEEQYREVHPD